MLKKSCLILSLMLVASGCTREIYLQAVPCTEGNCGQKEVIEALPPCGCPELMMQTKTITYHVVDVPSPKVTYVNRCDNDVKNCKTVCHE